MKHSEHTHAHSHHAHAHSEACACEHGHEHSHGDDHFLSLAHRWVLSVLIVGCLLVFLRSFIVGQMLVRVTSYSTGADYTDVVRVCKKIITIDSANLQAWTALGYAYMDTSQLTQAIPVFEKVLEINPEDKGAASFELGQAYYGEGDYAKAIEYFERVESAGPHADTLLEADVLKYRHGTLGFRSLNSMQTLLKDLAGSYKKTGNMTQAAEVQKQYDIYKDRHSKLFF